jgi:hypothetical protein
MKTRILVVIAVIVQIGFDVCIGVEEWKRAQRTDADRSTESAMKTRKPQIQYGSIVSTVDGRERADDQKSQLQFGSIIQFDDTDARLLSNDPAGKHQ